MEGLKVVTTGADTVDPVVVAFAKAVAPKVREFLLSALVKPPDKILSVTALGPIAAMASGVLVRRSDFNIAAAAPASSLELDNLLAAVHPL